MLYAYLEYYQLLLHPLVGILEKILKIQKKKKKLNIETLILKKLIFVKLVLLMVLNKNTSSLYPSIMY